MRNIRILDCTLRDGGYINSWKFGKKCIYGTIRCLEDANIDIIECGFIREQPEDEDSSVFSSMQAVADVIYPKSKDVLYTVMVEHHNNVYHLIPEYDGAGADIIRVTFRIKEWEEAKNGIEEIMKKGYKVCVQPVGTTNYDDEALLRLLKDVNRINPFAFYLVDTLGVMYIHDMRKFFYLIDSHLSQNINLGFHSHNNLQMSFSNAQEMMRLAYKRNIIIDVSCYGMGRGVGNLPTELLADYININIGKRYKLIPILNIIDKYLMPIYAEHRWGYDLPYFLAATTKCHPNYASHLMKKETLDIEHIEKILSLIPHENRKEFNEELVESLYIDLQSAEIDDSESYRVLGDRIMDKQVVILGPGHSIIDEHEHLVRDVKGKYVICVNFVADAIPTDALFVSNEKRVGEINDISDLYLISTSNIKLQNSTVFNYSSLLGEGEACDNAGAMLIRILKRIGIKRIYLGGFDGFDVNSASNYAMDEYKTPMDLDDIIKKNNDIGIQLKESLVGVDYKVLTKTKYDI